MARGYRQAQVLLTCVELGVFAALADRRLSAMQLAAELGCDGRALELLLNAATALGLLEKRQGQFANTPLAAACLAPGGPANLGSGLRLEAAFYRRWGRLAEAVRSGQRPPEDRQDESKGDWVRSFVYGLYDQARPVAAFIATLLDLPRDRPLRLLDVGGGHGAYSLALAQRYPLLTATVFDLPPVVPLAREIITQANLQGRVSAQAGDFHIDALGSGYDVALLFGVLNGEPPEGRPALVAKTAAALSPGGLLVLRDFVLDPDLAGPAEAALFGLQMLLATESGGLDTPLDWERWLTAAGFLAPHLLNLPDWIGGSLTLARKG
jgi:hypothetical protein